jgi:hypothetical protein
LDIIEQRSKHMTIPQQAPQRADEFDRVMSDMKAQLSSVVDRSPPPARSGPPAARPAVPVGPPAGQLWGPSSTPITSPLQLLVQVADNARRLHNQLLGLVENLTGEAPAIRAREVQKLPSALLPAVSALATEIDVVHAEIGQLLAHVKERLA